MWFSELDMTHFNSPYGSYMSLSDPYVGRVKTAASAASTELHVVQMCPRDSAET